MKPQAICIFELAVAGKFFTAFALRPLFARPNKSACNTFVSIVFVGVNSFKIAFNTTFCAFYIFMSQGNMRKPNRSVTVKGNKNSIVAAL
jgi:hypothetical protein